LCFRGALNKDEFELLLMAIGHSATSSEVDRYFDDMGIGGSDRLPFATFFEWWTSDIGARLFHRHK
jgi:Ca2+-binding EF-hand superfamily protein